MAVAWTDITNAQVAAGAPLTTALVTALRDNPEGIAQRASGAPKIFGVPYNYQRFTTSGTWTKPSNAEAGDKVLIRVVAAGGGGARNNSDSKSDDAAGGCGGAGVFNLIEDISTLGATETVTIGAAGAGRTGGSGNGGSAGDSIFGAVNNPQFTRADGGLGGQRGTDIGIRDAAVAYIGNTERGIRISMAEGGPTDGGQGYHINLSSAFGNSVYGGGGAGGARGDNVRAVGAGSLFAGNGGDGEYPGADGSEGEFPGGGGGGSHDRDGYDGGGAIIEVWCIKEG